MRDIYNDYPEDYSDAIVTQLNKEWQNRRNSAICNHQISKEYNMHYSRMLQNDNDITQPTPNLDPTLSEPTAAPSNELTDTPACSINESYKLYSLIASNYCSIIQLMNNIIAKTSSAKRETYQGINAALRVDSTTFNNTFYTSCNIERYTYCNYNQLVYTTMLSFINLTDSLSRLITTDLPQGTAATANTLRDNSFALFYQFVDSRPYRI